MKGKARAFHDSSLKAGAQVQASCLRLVFKHKRDFARFSKAAQQAELHIARAERRVWAG